MENHFVAAQGSVRLLTLDVKVYSLEAILKTAYWFTERAFLHLQYRDAQTIEVRLRAKLAAVDPDEIAGNFLNDLIDQRLRELVAVETEKTRDLIIAHALSKTALVNRHFETADPFSASHRVTKPERRSGGARIPAAASADHILDDSLAGTLNSVLRVSIEEQIQKDQLR
jgi:His-Xaa-Ser system protein HxsD